MRVDDGIIASRPDETGSPDFERPARRLEGQVWQAVGGKEGCRVGIVSGPELASAPAGEENQDDIGADGVLSARVHVEDPGNLDFQAGLLEGFALRCPPRILIGVDESRGECPASLLRFDGPANEQHLPALVDEDSGSDLRILEVNPTALGTDWSLAAKRQAVLDGMAAGGAKVDAPLTHP